LIIKTFKCAESLDFEDKKALNATIPKLKEGKGTEKID
jgi:hypothetical protein